MTGRIFVLSGNRAALLRTLADEHGCHDPEVIGFEEKAITRFTSTLAKVRARRTDLLVFATTQLSIQRFQVVLAFYLLVGRARHRLIIDQDGRSIIVTWPSFVILQLPRFAFEILASATVLTLTAVRLFVLSSSVRGKKQR